MIPQVIGLPLDEARKVLEAAGSVVVEIEKSAAPSDFRSRRPEDTRQMIEFVAVQWELPGGGVRLRVVSVPEEPKKKDA
ncbi:MAG: hypothetical protein WCX65_16790 [bacterium]